MMKDSSPMAYHPNSDGKTEKVSKKLKIFFVWFIMKIIKMRAYLSLSLRVTIQYTVLHHMAAFP